MKFLNYFFVTTFSLLTSFLTISNHPFTSALDQDSGNRLIFSKSASHVLSESQTFFLDEDIVEAEECQIDENNADPNTTLSFYTLAPGLIFSLIVGKHSTLYRYLTHLDIDLPPPFSF